MWTLKLVTNIRLVDMYKFKYVREENDAVVVLSGERKGEIIPRDYHLWKDLGVDSDEKIGNVEPHLTETEINSLKILSEREWRDAELIAVDELMKKAFDIGAPTENLSKYRIELRDYPQESSFPNGERPRL